MIQGPSSTNPHESRSGVTPANPRSHFQKQALAFYWQREWQKELRIVIKVLADLSFPSSCFFIYSVKIAFLRKTAQQLDLIISLTYANPGAYEKEGGQHARF